MQHIGPAAITTADDVDTLQFDWGTLQMLSDPHSTGADSSSFGLVHVHPGSGHARHNHPEADEIIFVRSGTGTQMLDDKDPVAIGPGDAIYIPKGVYHATQNTGEESLELIIVYTPAGPEQIFRDMEESTIIPADG
ncbi:cupin domain-containing protein [Salisaeta longa]|uniref:cupin domain-containing protein n=1 Tax=Salisaeta longa TaxID=503170 RepID=UPI0003B70BEB|nr:cupin domain-containing protein [Salisaeta longa]